MWRRAFSAVGRIGEHFGGSNVFGAPSLFGMSLGEAFPVLMRLLYAAGGAAVPVERFHRAVRDAVNERMGCVVDDLAGDVEQRLWRRDVTALLDALELLGAVTLSESLDTDDHEELSALAGRDDPDPTWVALTPIGLWAVHEMLVDDGVDAPLVGELADEDVEYVCVRWPRARPAVADAELAAWVAARPRARPRRSSCASWRAPRSRGTASWPCARWPVRARPSRTSPAARPTAPAAPRPGPRVECDARSRRA
jgi:hypothetical protein